MRGDTGECAGREVEDSTACVRSPVRDTNRHALSVAGVGNEKPRTERQRTVRGGHLARIEDLTASGASPCVPVSMRPVERSLAAASGGDGGGGGSDQDGQGGDSGCKRFNKHLAFAKDNGTGAVARQELGERVNPVSSVSHYPRSAVCRDTQRSERIRKAERLEREVKVPIPPAKSLACRVVPVNKKGGRRGSGTLSARP
jgi:hypothetical protein